MRIPGLFAGKPGSGTISEHVCCYLTDERPGAARGRPVLVDAHTGAVYTARFLAGRPVEMLVRGAEEYAFAERGRRAGYAIAIDRDALHPDD
jgi:hypothetical protein